MLHILNVIVGLIMQYLPGFGGALGLAKTAADTTHSIKQAMDDLHIEIKARDVSEHPDYAGRIVQLAAIEGAYKATHAALSVATYAILT